jgi:hypothetical protein
MNPGRRAALQFRTHGRTGRVGIEPESADQPDPVAPNPHEPLRAAERAGRPFSARAGPFAGPNERALARPEETAPRYTPRA